MNRSLHFSVFLVFISLLIPGLADAQCNGADGTGVYFGSVANADNGTICANNPVLPARMEIDIRNVTEGAGDVKFVIDWNDGITQTVSATKTASNRFFASVPHTFPATGVNVQCEYRPTVKIQYGTNAPCAASLGVAPRFVRWNTDNENSGTLILGESVGRDQTYRVLAGVETNVTFTDRSTLNCVPPELMLGTNNMQRWRQFVYGSINTITGLVKVGGATPVFPFSGPVSQSSQPIENSGFPIGTTQVITIPATAQVGERFRVRMNYWNTCNSYSGGRPPVETWAEINVVSSAQSINFTALPAKTFDSAPFALSATATSGLAVVYASSDPAVASISGSTLTIHSVGSTTITASQPGNGTYAAATPVAHTLVVEKATQTLTFPPIPEKLVTDIDFDITASSSSSLALSYASDNTSVATIDINGKIAIHSAGTANITVRQEGDDNYEAATPVTQPLIVRKVSQTITFDELQVLDYGNAPFVLQGASSSGLLLSYVSDNPAVAQVTGTTVTIMGAGTATITASQGGNPNYAPATSVARNLVVNKATQTITFAALVSHTFGDTPFNLSATSSTPLAVSYTSDNQSVAQIDGNNVTIVGAGTATITASQGGSTNYAPATSVSRSLVVNKAPQTITFATLASRTYGDASFNLSATSSAALAVSYTSDNQSVAQIDGNNVTIVGAGTATITASQGGSANYATATSVSRSLVVNKAPQTITFAALASRTYGDAPFNLSATSSAALPVSYTSDNTTIAQINGSTVTIVGTGTATITASQGGSTNYAAALSVARTLVINKGSQTITFPVLSARTYGDAPFELSATSSATLPVTYTSDNLTVAKVNGSTVTIAGAGTANITVSQSGNTNYEAAAPVVRSLVVAKASQTITFDLTSEVTEGSDPIALSAVSTSGLAVSFNSSDATVANVNGSILSILGSGSSTIEARQEGNENYLAASPIAHTLKVSTVLAVENGSRKGMLKVYPNPTTGAFRLVLPAGFSQQVDVSVFGPTGERVYHKITTAADELDFGLHVSPGLYTVHVVDMRSSKSCYDKLLVQ